MPNIITGTSQTSQQTLVDWRNVPDENYVYPEDLDLRPGSKLHDKLRDAIYNRANESAKQMSQRHGSWKEIDRILTAYIETTEEEDKVRRTDKRKPVSIVFPYGFAIMETLLAYMTAAFLRDPIFSYEGQSPEDVNGAFLLEKVIALHTRRNKVGLNLHTFWRDGFAYGTGYAAPVWKVEKGARVRARDLTKRGRFTGLIKYIGRTRELERNVTIFEGNALENIDPYLALPDPNVPSQKVQEGEFFGWKEETNLMNLLVRETSSEGTIFNARYVKHVKDRRSSIYNSDPSGRNLKTGLSDRRNRSDQVTSPIDVIHKYVKLIPKEWELSAKEIPEIWKFSLVNDEVVVEARPLDLAHGRIPVAANSPDFDGYSTSPVSRLEIIYGLQETLDWLFNSHIANVRKAINDMLIVDPYMVNYNDVKDPKEGKLIRLRRPAWGKGVRDAIQQLNVQDVTRGHIADSSWIVQWMQKTAGTDDPVMGALRQGGPERLTAKEFTGSQGGAFSRLQRLARIIGMQGIQEIGYMFAQHTLQMMEEDVYIKTVGEWPDEVSGLTVKKNRVKVSPYDLLVDFDVVVRDGSVPVATNAELWIKLLGMIREDQTLMQRFDTAKVFKYIARNLGAESVADFELVRTRTAGPSEMNSPAADNLIPLREGLRGHE